MKEIYRQIPLYRLLMYAKQNNVPKTVLDCGAGGNMPPLGMFFEQGYETSGIEYSKTQIELAKAFEQTHEMNLQIQQGDMRNLPYSDNQFGLVYSYNSIFHMKKEEVEQSLNEMKRVLRPDGLLFVNFLSVEDFRCKEGKDFFNHQYLQWEEGEEIMHSYFEDQEPETYFSDMKMIFKEKRIMNRMFEGDYIKQGFLDYILQK